MHRRNANDSASRILPRTVMAEPVTIEKFGVGQSVRRLEDPHLVQGLGRFADDVTLPRQAWGVVVRSPHAHARIRRIDVTRARAAAGVLAVLTGDDLAADGLGNLPTDKNRKRRDGTPAFPTPRPALAQGRVRHVGDPVAFIVAESAAQAADAAERVVVDYEPLPAVALTADATRAGAPAVWDEAPDNVAFLWEVGPRDAVERAFAAAAHVTRLPFVVTRVAPAPLEPRGAVGEFDRRTSRYALYTGIQAPHGLRTLLAEQVLKVPQSHLRVVTGEAGVYTTPAIHVQTTGVFTHTTPTGPYRGAGRPEATYAIERVIDLAAAELGIDPIELRRRNLIPASAMPFKTGLVFTYDCGDFARGLDMALAMADYKSFPDRRAAARQRGKLRGLGIANPIEVAGGPYTSVNPDTAEVRVNADGSVTVFAGSTSMGQGNATAFAQIVSERLGVPPARIRVLWGDSDALGAGRGNGGPRGTAGGGSAVLRATEKVIERGRRIAAAQLEAAPEDVVFRDGKFTVTGTDKGVAFTAVARAAYQPKPPGGGEPGFSETAAFTPPAVTFPNGCHVCEVEIDEATGAVHLARYSVVDDVGHMGNPMLVKGQIHGGIAQGVGQALFEALTYDRAGQLLTGSFMDYAMPRADDLPAFEVDSFEVPTTVNPLGAKGVGEAGTVGALAAVVNAVNDALAPLGVRHLDMPVTAERVWRAIRDARAAC